MLSKASAARKLVSPTLVTDLPTIVFSVFRFWPAPSAMLVVSLGRVTLAKWGSRITAFVLSFESTTPSETINPAWGLVMENSVMLGMLLKGFFSIFSRAPPKTTFVSEVQLKKAFFPKILIAGSSSVVRLALSQEAKASSPISSTRGIFMDLIPLHSLKASLPIFFTLLKSIEVISSFEERRPLRIPADSQSSSPQSPPLW